MASRRGPKPPQIAEKVFTRAALAPVEGSDRVVSFTVSTGTVDRDNDTILAGGWQLTNFLANPVILWAHTYDMLPIGRARSLNVSESGLAAQIEFTPAGVNPFADTVYDLVKAGFLNAASVGFKPMKYAFNETRGGVDFLEQELLEISVVPVPANPLALVEARSAGIDIAPLKAWAQSVLDVPDVDETDDEPAIGSPTFIAEMVAYCAKRGRVLSAENESELRSAIDDVRNGVEQGLARLQRVLSKLEVAPQEQAADPEDMKADDTIVTLDVSDADPFVLELADVEPEIEDVLYLDLADEAETLDVDPTLLHDCLVAAVSDVVRKSVRDAILFAQGRVE